MNIKSLVKREISTIIFFIVLIFVLISCSGNGERLPNIIIIFTDDQGYADLGVFGARDFETPNLDRMATEGMRFTNFYVSQAVCSASRAALMTGCYSERVSIQGALTSWSQVGLNPEEETIAELLKKKNYATAAFGKWHLGHAEQFLPLQQGFDEYLGLPYSNDMWPVDYNGSPITEKNPGSNPGKIRYPPLPLIEGNDKVGEILTLDDQATLTTRYTEKAIKFIEKNKERPFFLYLPHSMPHVPLGVSDKFKGKSKQGLYGDVIMEIDWSVGEILNVLGKFNLENNTLVIFASDNGPWLSYGNHAGSALPLREGKGTTWEGGARVPCIMKWPGKIPAGTVCNQLAASIDILPTIAAIASVPLPENKIDGVNILPLLENRTDIIPRDHYFFYYGGELQAVRQGKWKLYFPHQYRSYEGVAPGRDGYPGPYNYGKTTVELYDLETDISETRNLVREKTGIVDRLTVLADRAREALGDMLTGKKGKEVRQPGRIGNQQISQVSHLAVGKNINLKNNYDVKYSGGGATALIDGIIGTSDYTDGTWQGFEAADLEVLIDLGVSKMIKRVVCQFLEDQMVWIFFPKSLEVAVSEDGSNFKVIKSFIETAVKRGPVANIKDYTVELKEPEAGRFIRVKASNINLCPEWHQGAGGKAWLFADEILVK